MCNFTFTFHVLREGNGNPLHCSCLENPRDGGTWWAASYGVAQSQTRLKWLSSSSRALCNCHPGVYVFRIFLSQHFLLLSLFYRITDMSYFFSVVRVGFINTFWSEGAHTPWENREGLFIKHMTYWCCSKHQEVLDSCAASSRRSRAFLPSQASILWRQSYHFTFEVSLKS